LRTVLAGVVILSAAIITIVVDQVIVVLCLRKTLLVELKLFPITLLISEIV